MPVHITPVTPNRLPIGVKLIGVADHEDHRGVLVPIEFREHVPFLVSRFFSVTDVPPGVIRGNHAHFKCHQALVALQGSLEVRVSDGSCEVVVELTSRRKELLHIPPMIWGTQRSFSSGAVLGVFCSHAFEAEDYLDDYSDFVGRRRAAAEDDVSPA
jgi:UDP-2-acetamido-3-amino-2,3-dideoxy-glucuronate N-acetyltransferase